MDPITAVTAAAGALEIVRQVGGALRSGARAINGSSLTELAHIARVEPVLIIDSDVSTVDFLPDLVNSMHTQFAGYYLQAANMLASIGGVTLAQKLAPLNPNRSIWMESRNEDEGSTDWRLSLESYKHTLPFRRKKTLVMEATTIDDGPQQLRELANLSTGRMYNVKFKENNNEAVLPISIRLLATQAPSRQIINMMTVVGTDEKSAVERFHGWRSGRLAFWRDNVLCKDLLDRHRKTLMKDKSGLYGQIIGREAGAKLVGLARMNPSLATASTLAIISSDTLAQIEQSMGGKIRSQAVRKQIFENTSLMILAVVDKQFSMTTFYFRGMDETLDASARDLKGASKGGGSEVMDIMKAFIAGSTVSL